MKNIKFIFLAVLISIFVSSCVKPPAGIEKINSINFIKDILDSINKYTYDDKKRTEYFKNLMNNFNSVLVLYKDTTFSIKSREDKTDNEDFAYTLNKNQFMIKKPIYITFEKKDLMLSFDNKTWYSTKK